MREMPSFIRQDDLIAAIAPLLDLIGVGANEIYVDPPLTVGDSVTFTAHPSVADRAREAGLNVTDTLVAEGDPDWEQRAVTISIPQIDALLRASA